MNNALYLATIWVVLWLPGAGRAGDWPQFRGPQASGVDDAATIPVRWDVESGRNLRWKTPVPGLAHASPIVWQERVYVATAVGSESAELKVGLYGNIVSAEDQDVHQWRVLALDRGTGRVLWDRLGHEGMPKVKRHPKASHCNSTPATDGARVVAILGSEGLFCFGRDGALLWKRDLGSMDAGYFAVPSAQWGFGSSPVIHQERVIVQCDVQTNSFLAAFDVRDGREIWRAARADVPTWCSPTVATVQGRPRVLVNGWHHTGGYDWADGREIWRLDGGGDIPVPTPVVAHGLAYFTSAHGRFRPMQAIRLEAVGDITPEAVGQTNQFIAWAHARRGNYMQTPIAVGELLFSCFDNGVLTCFDARTGRVHYEERLRAGGDGFTASPVSDGRHLFFPSETGDVYVVPVTNRFSVVSTNRMGETVMASGALSGGNLLLRTRGHLVAIGESP
ncbi:MAG: PQQ-binding-like beta-propeller repeat protein [Verrucomicrobiales bacterium]|nr:PQQ-binding-like beta-propeller repeat protein [Verrucomicrobiales bacterium]